MPYISASDRNILKDETVHTDNVGDYNYLFTLAYLKVWLKEGNQRYKTIHALRKASIFPETIDEVSQVNKRLINTGARFVDLAIARDLAFLEFYKRIGTDYEELAIERNGDLIEYQQAEDLMADAYMKQYKGE